MKYTEQEILDISKKILKDLEGDFFKDENLQKVIFDLNDVPIRGTKKGIKHRCWTAIINEPIFDSSIFLVISDDDGEPIYIQNKHSVSEIVKDSNGIYIIK
jgi:hypothetical protein